MGDKTIYTLGLHEGTNVGDIWVMRVPGGWIYDCWDMHHDMPKLGTFVPYNNEFQKL